MEVAIRKNIEDIAGSGTDGEILGGFKADIEIRDPFSGKGLIAGFDLVRKGIEDPISWISVIGVLRAASAGKVSA